jgi:hypothetical protein
LFNNTDSLSKTNFAILITIAVVATLLSIFSYQYYTSTSARIADIASHNLASNVDVLITQQKNFSIFIVIAIAAVAFGIAFLLFLWNKRLEICKYKDCRFEENKRFFRRIKQSAFSSK